MVLFKNADGICVLESQTDIIQTFHEPFFGGRIHIKGEVEGRLAVEYQSLLFQVYGCLDAFLLLNSLENLVYFFFCKLNS